MNKKRIYVINSESNNPHFMKIVMEVISSQIACNQKANSFGFVKDAKKLDCVKNA
jgi:hypothetical protein